MKIHIIYYDNGESWEDHRDEIFNNQIYSLKSKAEIACDALQAESDEEIRKRVEEGRPIYSRGKFRVVSYDVID